MDACHLIYEYHFLKKNDLAPLSTGRSPIFFVFSKRFIIQWDVEMRKRRSSHKWHATHNALSRRPSRWSALTNEKTIKWNKIFQTRFPLFFISMSIGYKNDCWINEFQENRFAGEQPTTTPSQSILHSTGKCNRTFKNCKTTLPGATG